MAVKRITFKISLFPVAHLGNPNKFDCSRFVRWVESEKLQVRLFLPKRIAVLSDWRSEKIPTVASSPVRNVHTISRHSSTSRIEASMIRSELLVLYFIVLIIYEYFVSGCEKPCFAPGMDY